MATLTMKRNGVDVGELKSTIQAIQEEPGLAKFQFRVSNRWLDGGHNRAAANDYYGAGEERSRDAAFTFEADEPPVLLGEDRGANPVEHALAALSACLTTSLVYHAAARGIEIEALESRLEGDLDLHGFLGLSDQVRPGYQNVRVTMKATSDAPAEALAELAKFSPVFDIFTNPVPVSIRVEKE